MKRKALYISLQPNNIDEIVATHSFIWLSVIVYVYPGQE